MENTELPLDICHYYRGMVISEFNRLEKALESVLINNFIDDTNKIDDFHQIVLDRLTFESKRQSVRSLFNKIEIKKGFEKTKNNSYPNSKLFDNIRQLIEERNKFAHYFTQVPNGRNDYVIGLIEFRDAVEIYWYNSDKIQSIISSIDRTIDELLKLDTFHRES